MAAQFLNKELIKIIGGKMEKAIVSFEDEAEKQLSEEQQQEIVDAIKSLKKRIKAIKKEIEKLEKEADEKKDDIKKLNAGDTSVIEKTVTTSWTFVSPYYQTN